MNLDQATPVLLEVQGILIWELFPTHGWGEPADEAPKDWKEHGPYPYFPSAFSVFWGRGEVGMRVGSYCLMRTELQLGKMERVLGLDGGDGCTTM